MHTNCPDCGDVLRGNATACSCGWKASLPARDSADTKPGQCCYEHHGRRCEQRGSVSSPTVGGGRLFCSAHFAEIADQGRRFEPLPTEVASLGIKFADPGLDWARRIVDNPDHYPPVAVRIARSALRMGGEAVGESAA